MANGKKAPAAEMNDLHGIIAREFKTQVTMVHKRVVKVDGENQIIEERCPAAILNAARQFLKDNKIECTPEVFTENEDFLQPGDLEFESDTMPPKGSLN